MHLLACANVLPFSGFAYSSFGALSSGVPSSRKPSLMSLTREDWLAPQGSLVSAQLTLGCDCLRMDCDPWEGRPRAVSIPAVYLAWPSTGLSRGAH